MDSQKKQGTRSDPHTHKGATPARRGGERSTAVSSAVAPDILETTAPSAVGGQAPTTSLPTSTDTVSREELEKLLQRLRPGLIPSQTLASLTAELPSSNPTQLTPSQPISQPSHIEIPIAENEEGGDEWFDAVAGMEAPMGEKGEEEVYSGATEVLSEGGTEDRQNDTGDEMVKEGELNKEEEVEQPIQTEMMTVGTEMVKAGELNREEEVEQQLRPEGVEMNPTGGRIEDVVIIQDDDEEDREEQSKEDFGQGVSGHEEGPPRNVVRATVRRRRLLIDEASEEEEEEVPFQPIGEPLSQRQPLREEALVDRAGQLDVPTERAACAEERERLERLERKRKGKQIAKPVKKKARQESTTVVIQESRSERAVVPQEKESDEDEALR